MTEWLTVSLPACLTDWLTDSYILLASGRSKEGILSGWCVASVPGSSQRSPCRTWKMVSFIFRRFGNTIERNVIKEGEGFGWVAWWCEINLNDENFWVVVQARKLQKFILLPDLMSGCDSYFSQIFWCQWSLSCIKSLENQYDYV